MNIIQLFRILLDYRWLIVGTGLVLSATIWYNTRGEKKVYSTETTIYTGLATGFDIEKGTNTRLDLFATNAKFDNLLNIIKSRKTHEETGIRLLAKHLYEDELGLNLWSHLNTMIPDSIRMVLVNRYSLDNTIERITEYISRNDSNLIFRIINSGHPFYGVGKISSVSVKRIQSSDLINLNYSTNNPVICKQTLEILTDVFLRRYKSLSETQTNSVVSYFENRVDESENRLRTAENSMLYFNESNRIINYYEQTKFIAEQKEELDREYQEEIMALASAKAALDEIESRLDIKKNLSLQNDKINEKRKQIGEIESKIAFAEIYHKGDLKEIMALKNESERLKLELTDDLANLFHIGRSTSGIAMESLLEQWLGNVVTVEETQARADVILQRKEEFFRKYDTFAPLGSELKRIEREIELAEEEYMTMLNSLNQSRLKQQNLEQGDKVKILDPPFLPLKAKKSIRKILIIVGFLVGAGLVSAVLILLEFIDSTIKTPDRAKEIIDIDLLGVYPRISKDRNKNIDWPYITNRLVELMIQRIKLVALKIEKPLNQPFQLVFCSTREQEGKRYVTELLAEKLRNAGNKVMIIKPYDEAESQEGLKELKSIYKKTLFQKLKEKYFDSKLAKVIGTANIPIEDIEEPIKSSEIFYYEINNDFFDVSDINTLIQNKYFSPAGYDYILVLLPALLRNEFPASIVQHSHMSFLITRANRKWNKADTSAFKLFKRTISHQAQLILNAVEVDYLDAMVGELPKKRSWRRKLAKKIITFDFWSRGGI